MCSTSSADPAVREDGSPARSGIDGGFGFGWLFPLGAYWIAVAILVIGSVARNDGRLIYSQDDAYIHMAIARNFALHGVWGLSRYEFTSSSSAPLWTLLVAAVDFTFGIHEVTPLVLNLLAGTALIVSAHWILAATGANRFVVAITLLAIVFATPLPALSLAGMEAILQSLVALWFVHLVGEAARGRNVDRRLLAIVAALSTAVRYEGGFLVAAAGAVLAARKQIATAFLVGSAALAPILLYGAWSIAHGWWLLPNSVLLKASVPSSSFGFLAEPLLRSPSLFAARPEVALLVVATILRHLLRGTTARGAAIGVMFVAAALLHFSFARIDSFHRYEAYLVLLGIVALFSAWTDVRTNLRPLIVAVAAPQLAIRGIVSLWLTIPASANVYEQQYQMGLFFARHYPGRTIAANDVGAISFLGDVRIVDIVGIGSMETAALTRHGRLRPESLAEIANRNGVAVAVAYDEWLERYGGAPPSWRPVERWRISQNVVCGDDAVTFYAVNPREEASLEASLEEFARELPRHVLRLPRRSTTERAEP